MKSFTQQNTLRIKVPEFNRRVETALGLSRGDPVVQKEYISPVDQGRFSVIGKLESSVSLLQTARINMEKINAWLQEMREFLENDRHSSSWARIPASVVNNFLTDRLSQIKITAETTAFQGKALLNGKSGVLGRVTGNDLRFVRGSARVVSSDAPGYALAIYQSPKPAILIGAEPISPQTLRQENTIGLIDGNHEIRYRLQTDESAETLVQNLQQCLNDHGIDISVFRTEDDHLLFRHNQLGSRTGFKGISYRSRLVSDEPGEYRPADPGIDVAGTIGSESAHGDGGFLIGDKGNSKTDGLVVYYDGQVAYPGQIVGYVDVRQKGIMVPLDASESRVEILSIPSLQPEILSIGVATSSGFSDLSAIRGNTESECRDSHKMILWAMTYLEFLLDELRWKEKIYVDRAVELLRSTISPQSAGEDVVYLSKDKAKDMVGQLKTMLTPDSVMSLSKWG